MIQAQNVHILSTRLGSVASAPQEGREQMPVKIPYTGEIMGHIPSLTPDDVKRTVESARAAQPAWAAKSFSDRAAILLHFHDLLLDRQSEVLDLIQLENGKARLHALEEVLDTAIVTRYYARRAEEILAPRRAKGALPVFTRTIEMRQPIGVAGFIVPWNYPLNLSITDAIPALMAGNAVVIRPDPQTSLTALWAVDLLRQAGMPREVCAVVTGDGPPLGEALGRYVDALMFTGSTRVGRIVGRQAAERLIPFSLELGGKNPMLVLRDANLDKTVYGAVRGCFVGAGQVCISIERMYVHDSIYEQFLASFAEATRKLKLGAALDYSMDVGSLTNDRQLAAVERHVDDALSKGARLIVGGRRRPDPGPLFYEPTILADVTEEMLLFAEETFGPVVSVYRFRDEAEAVERANRTAFGLSASIWTRDTARGQRLAAQIRAGSVNVNEAYAATWASVDSAVGGMKESGFLARHGAEGILKYTVPQTIAVQRLIPVAPLPGMDRTFYARMMTFLLRLLRRIHFA